MNIEIIARTMLDDNTDYAGKTPDALASYSAAVCYMKDDMNTILSEDPAKTERRLSQIKGSGHHSPFDHYYYTLSLEGISKALAMVLNNEKQLTTSEKSARYTRMILDNRQQALYDKWMDIFKTQISKRYPEDKYSRFDETTVTKLAQENARYVTSIFNKSTTMVYTTSHRQFNIIYSFMQNELNRESNNPFYNELKGEFTEFCGKLNELNIVDSETNFDNKQRAFSFVNPRRVDEHFGDVYSTAYNGSFAQIAQAHRHRTIGYHVNLQSEDKFFVPPILKNDHELIKEWLDDMKSMGGMPQGQLITINEYGTLDNFILKTKERLCTYAQLEINNQTKKTLDRYYGQLVFDDNPLAEQLEPYTHGARCKAGYKCTSPCKFSDGIELIREI